MRSLLRPSIVVATLAASLVVAPAAQSVSASNDERIITGVGRIFHPNPVVTLRDQQLTDRRDADQSVLQPAYAVATLTHLDGSGLLRGAYADVDGAAGRAIEADLTFVYTRSDDRFEQVMAYFAVTSAQEYLQRLGIRGVNDEPQNVRIAPRMRNGSFFDAAHDVIRLGVGGVDDGEDMEIIWHEYGHAIQDSQVPGFGRNHDARAIAEGFSDYWAATMSVQYSHGYGVTCIGEWDATSYTPGSDQHCLRRVDLDLTVHDQTGQVHHDGQVWSRALWDIHQALGRATADRIIVRAQFDFLARYSFRYAALDTIAAARRIAGGGAARVVRAAFARRGIL
jgi:hypothetical protein